MRTAYATSESTRMAFIMAAGELFAKHGVKAVCVRTIAMKSGENTGSIHYHFGGKRGLLDAVVDYASKPWLNDPLGKMLRDNESLFSSRNGQALLTFNMIDLFFKIILDEERPSWCGMLMFQILQRDLSVAKSIVERCVTPTVNALSELYKRITGNDDPEMILSWLATITAPVHLFSMDKATIGKIHHINPQTASIKEKLMGMTIKSALVNLGLDRKEITSK